MYDLRDTDLRTLLLIDLRHETCNNACILGEFAGLVCIYWGRFLLWGGLLILHKRRGSWGKRVGCFWSAFLRACF